LNPLQSIPNQISAIIGGRLDFAPLPATAGLPLVARGEAKLVGWVGDETPWQFGALFTATKTASEKNDKLTRFLRAYRKGARDYHDAFANVEEKRDDGATAPAVLAVIAKYTGEPIERIKLGITYPDPDARLDVKDVLHQIEWYKARNMLKEDVNGADFIDRRFVVP
jgi:NitT/TauT family transport system substrate-binding protein